jgi:hypothetical protein
MQSGIPEMTAPLPMAGIVIFHESERMRFAWTSRRSGSARDLDMRRIKHHAQCTRDGRGGVPA